MEIICQILALCTKIIMGRADWNSFYLVNLLMLLLGKIPNDLVHTIS